MDVLLVIHWWCEIFSAIMNPVTLILALCLSVYVIAAADDWHIASVFLSQIKCMADIFARAFAWMQLNWTPYPVQGQLKYPLCFLFLLHSGLCAELKSLDHGCISHQKALSHLIKTYTWPCRFWCICLVRIAITITLSNIIVDLIVRIRVSIVVNTRCMLSFVDEV